MKTSRTVFIDIEENETELDVEFSYSEESDEFVIHYIDLYYWDELDRECTTAHWLACVCYDQIKTKCIEALDEE